jgi:hypothetical protein
MNGFYIAGGDGFSFYTADNQTTLANRPSGYLLKFNGKFITCK